MGVQLQPCVSLPLPRLTLSPPPGFSASALAGPPGWPRLAPAAGPLLRAPPLRAPPCPTACGPAGPPSWLRRLALQAPFCVHPKTGKVCVPLEPSAADEFDPDGVPTVHSLMRQLPAQAAGKVRGGALSLHLTYSSCILQVIIGNVPALDGKAGHLR